MKTIRRFYRWCAAYFRLDLKIVCEESRDKGPWEDFHDYPDDVIGKPWAMCQMTCKRCGKKFYI